MTLDITPYLIKKRNPKCYRLEFEIVYGYEIAKWYVDYLNKQYDYEECTYEKLPYDELKKIYDETEYACEGYSINSNVKLTKVIRGYDEANKHCSKYYKNYNIRPIGMIP